MTTFRVDVWGDFACFSRPESRVERFSYPIMTPSAARGVLDAIYSKNLEFYWQIEQIDILMPVQFIALRRNEVKNKISRRAVESAIKSGELSPIQVDATKDSAGNDKEGRTQRQTIALKDVKYRIHAHIVPRSGFYFKDLEKQFERRMRYGKCFYQPYLGQREFVAYFEATEDETSPIALTQELGLMVYDIFDLNATSTDNGRPYISLFQASIVNGSMEIPSWQDTRVKKPERR